MGHAEESRNAAELHDGQAAGFVEPVDEEFQADVRLAARFHLRRGAERIPRPAGSRLEARARVGGAEAAVTFIGRSAAHGGVRAESIVPVRVESEVVLEG